MPDSDPGDLESRVTQVERELAQLREDVAIVRSDAGAARVLAAGADHDVPEVRAELRAHTEVLNALRETQLEQQSEMRAGFARVDTEIARLDADMRAGFATVHGGITEITSLLENLAEKNGER